ncbi:MAG: pyridoxal 5'-phosphate synthase glutaminase subunit PdxT [Acidobacteria bacterium]|nr:pyridoxal 5'-phosphate synthase glutaminase subunit PdxT [Acidobacteriota bacterium]
MKIGVFALQGDFERHGEMLRQLGVEPVYVNRAAQLADLDALVLPGGESSTMVKLLDDEKMFDPLVEFAKTKSIFGTCAGTILLASGVTAPVQRSLQAMDISVERNAYGRQVDSSIRRVMPEQAFEERTSPGELEVVFIRAPIIRQVRGDARVLVSFDSQPILVEQGRHLAATFHPELTNDTRIHELFLAKLRQP